jgi:hypothetical protein
MHSGFVAVDDSGSVIVTLYTFRDHGDAVLYALRIIPDIGFRVLDAKGRDMGGRQLKP